MLERINPYKIAIIDGDTWKFRKSPEGKAEVRRNEHLGGPWISVGKILSNFSLRPSFRKQLSEASARFMTEEIVP